MQPSHGNSQYFLGVYPIIYPVYHACPPSPNTNSECIVPREHDDPPCPPPPDKDEPHNIKGYSSFGGISFKFDKSYGTNTPAFTDVSGGYFRIDTSNLQTIRNIQLSSYDSSYDSSTSSSYSSYFSALSSGHTMILYNVSKNTSIIYKLTANPLPLFGGSSYVFSVSYKSGKIIINVNQNDVYIVTFSGGGGGAFSFTNLIPPASNVYTLGSPEFPWKDLYLGSNSLYIDQFKMSVNADGNNLTVIDTISSNPNDIVFDFNKINTLTAPSTIVSTITENIRTGGLLQDAVLSTIAESITTPQSLIQSALVSTISTNLKPINVNKIIAGPNVTITPTNGIGVVTISSTEPVTGTTGPTGFIGPVGLRGPSGPTGLFFLPISTITNVNDNMPFYIANKSIIPDTDSVYDLGATGLAFRSRYFSASTIYLGNTSVSTDSLGNIIFTNSSGDVSYGPTGPTGSSGSQIYAGIAPTGPTGNQNDLYLNTISADLYQYNDSTRYTLDSNSYLTTIPLTFPGGSFSVDGMVADDLGNLYATTNSNCIVKIDSSGNCSVFAGTYSRTASDFNIISNPVIDSNRNLFVFNAKTNNILKIDPSGNITTFAGSGVFGYLDGNGTTARFGSVHNLAIDKNDNIYAGHAGLIRKIDKFANVTTYIGSIDTSRTLRPFKAGNGTDAILPRNTFQRVGGTLAVDKFGNLYGGFAGIFNYDSPALSSYLIFKVDTNRNLTAYTPNNKYYGYQDGPIAIAKFRADINLIVIDSNNNIYVSEYFNHLIRKIDTSDNVTTFVGKKDGTDDIDGQVGTAHISGSVHSGCIDLNNNMYMWTPIDSRDEVDFTNGYLKIITPTKTDKGWTPLLNIAGPTGQTAPTGPTGPIGETGNDGPTGLQAYTPYTYIISMTIASSATIVGATVNNMLLPDGNTIVAADSFGNFTLPSVLGGGTVTTLIDGSDGFTISFPPSSYLNGGLFTNVRRYASTTSGKGSEFSYSSATGSSQLLLIPNSRTIKFLDNTPAIVGYVAGSLVYFAFDYIIGNTIIVPWEVAGF